MRGAAAPHPSFFFGALCATVVCEVGFAVLAAVFAPGFALSGGASTCPENSQSGSTCTVRISRIISAVGAGGGSGDDAENVSGGITTLYSGISVAGGSGDAGFGAYAFGCTWFAYASTLYSTLDFGAVLVGKG